MLSEFMTPGRNLQLPAEPPMSNHVSQTELPLGSALRPSDRHRKSIGPVRTWNTSYNASQYYFSKPSGQDIKPCSFSIMPQTTRLCSGCPPCSQHEHVWRQSKPQHARWLESIDSTTAVANVHMSPGREGSGGYAKGT